MGAFEDQMRPYHEIYEETFFQRADGIHHWLAGKMRYGDTVAALGYALGVSSFEELRRIFGFSGLGKEHDGDKRTAIDQINTLSTWLWARKRLRTPASVLDIGGGKGEAACALSYLDTSLLVQSVEPHMHAGFWSLETMNRLFMGRCGQVKLINVPCPECLPLLDLEKLDTLLMVESIEHIPEERFLPVWEAAKISLIRNKGRLVVANWMDYHPLEVTGDEHCRLINDEVYRQMAEGGKVVYQEGSHLVVDFGGEP